MTILETSSPQAASIDPLWADPLPTAIRFFVPGIPAPGGSKRAFVLRRRDGSVVTRPNGSPIVNVTDDAGERNKNWRQSVAVFARQAYSGPLLMDLLAAEFLFVVPRPRSHYRTGRNAHLLRDDAPAAPGKKPDATKLLRSTEDALTQVLWADDALIVHQVADKRYADPAAWWGDKAGCWITVKPWKGD